MRSFLFVPGDSERKLAKAEDSAADALVLDLEDAVSADRVEIARKMVREYLHSHRDRSRTQLWVRINPMSTEKALPDLAAIVGGSPDGILLPKTTSAADAVLLDHYLSALEVREGVAAKSIRILPVATETAPALFNLGGFGGCSPAMWGAAWGGPGLLTAIASRTHPGAGRQVTIPYTITRTR